MYGAGCDQADGEGDAPDSALDQAARGFAEEPEEAQGEGHHTEPDGGPGTRVAEHEESPDEGEGSDGQHEDSANLIHKDSY